MSFFRLLKSVSEAVGRGALSVGASRLFHGWSASDLLNWIGVRHYITDELGKEQFLGLTNEAMAAGSSLMGLPSDEIIDAQLVPIIQPTPQGYFEGARYSYDVEVPWESTKTGQTGVYRIRHIDLDAMSYEEIEQRIMDRFREYKDASPKKFLPGEEIEDIKIYVPVVIDIVRGF